MIRLALAIILLLCGFGPLLMRGASNSAPPPTQSIASVSPTAASYTSGISSGTMLTGGTIAVTLSPSSPPFSGTLALSGTDASKFSLSSTTLPANLEANGTTPTCTSIATYNINIVPTQAGVTGSGTPSPVTITCNPVGSTTVMSKNFFNNSGSSTPAGGTSNNCSTAVNTCFPVHTFVGFAPGAVPSGSIAVPTVGGSAVRYQADRCARPWSDGSSAGCQFSLFIPQIGAGALEQVVWTVQAGSYNNTSACGVSCVTSNSNLNVKITDVNQTGVYAPGGDLLANVQTGAYLNPSTGAVTSAVVRSGYVGGSTLYCSSNVCNLRVYSYVNAGGAGNCAGSPAYTISNLPLTGVTGATTNVTTAGSGCPMGPGSSNATASINTALGNGAYSSGNHCGIVRKYLEGPVADGWEVACRFTDDNGTTGQWAPPAPVMRAWVEDWKNADGTVYGLRAVAMVTQDQYVHLGTLSPFTYDVQWYNGATPTSSGGSPTCIRCDGPTYGTGTATLTNAMNYLPLTRIVQQFGSAGITFGADARMDWIPVNAGSATSAELNAVVGTYQAADKVYFKGSHLIPPLDDNIVLGGSAVITATGTQFSVPQICCAADMGSFNSNNLGEVTAEGAFSSGGDHPFFFTPANDVMQYLSMTQAADYGFSWLQNIRNAAATSFSCNAGMYDPDTRYAIDLIDGALWTPPAGMVARPSASIVNFSGVLANDMIGAEVSCWVNSGAGWVNFFETAQADYSHWQAHGRWAYVQEGEEWQLQSMDAEAQEPLMFLGTGYVQLGSTKYSATGAIIQGGSRLPAWSLKPLEEVTKFLPPADVNAQYDYQVFFNNIVAMMADTYAFTGTVTNCYFFCGPYVGSKPFDTTASGGPQGMASYFAGSTVNTASATASTEYFADAYLASILLDAEMLFPSESTKLDTWAHNYVDNYAIARGANNASCFVNWLDYIGYVSDSDKRFVPGWEADNSNPQHFNEYIWNYAGPTLTTYSGDPIVDAGTFNPGTGFLNAGGHVGSVTAGPVTVNPASTTTLSVNSTSGIQIGAIVSDLGAGCFGGGTCPGVGGALPTTTGAIPHHMYISAIGSGTITIRCGATGGCGSVVGAVQNGDVLAYSFRLDFPQSVGSDSSPLSQAGNPKMPAGTLIKPVWEATTNSGDNHLGSFPPTTSPANGINDSISTGGYVWCPDAANSEGTTGTILPHGGTCGVTTPINYAADGAVTWAWAPPLSACTGMVGNWRYGGGTGTMGNIGLKTEEDQLFHLARFATAVWGSNADRAAVISLLGPHVPPSLYTATPQASNFAWDSSFSYPTPPGQ